MQIALHVPALQTWPDGQYPSGTDSLHGALCALLTQLQQKNFLSEPIVSELPKIGNTVGSPAQSLWSSLQARCLETIPIYKFKAFGARRNALQNWSVKHTSDSILQPQFFVNKYSNDHAQRVRMASKIASGGFPGRQIEQIAFREASGTPQGRCLGNYLRIQNRSKPVTEALPRRK